MIMNWTPNSIFYACIAKDTTILTEFNPKNTHNLTDLANKYLAKTPAFHSVFSHTVHGTTYMFFINHPFVCFGIFDESLEKHNCLLFLKTVHDVFTSMIDKFSLGTMNPCPHCLQGEFGPVLSQLVGLKSEPSSKDGSEENLNECRGLSDDDVTCRRRCRSVWNKQVVVVLCMDLVVCAGLFVIWLWVCDGFRCVAN